MVATAEILEQSLKLKASERYMLLEILHQSLDKSDPEINRVWRDEVMRRVKAYDDGKLAIVSMEEVFRDL